MFCIIWISELFDVDAVQSSLNEYLEWESSSYLFTSVSCILTRDKLYDLKTNINKQKTNIQTKNKQKGKC